MEIRIKHKDGKALSFTILKDKITLGSAPDCDIVIDDASIAPHHLELQEQKSGRVLITDLGSDSGTVVNMQPLEVNTPTDFTTFFPAEVGTSVSIELLDETSSSGSGIMLQDGPINFFSTQRPTTKPTKPTKKPGTQTSIKRTKPKQGKKNLPKGGRSSLKTATRSHSTKKKAQRGNKGNQSSSKNLLVIVFILIGGYLFMNDGELPFLFDDPPTTPPPVTQQTSPQKKPSANDDKRNEQLQEEAKKKADEAIEQLAEMATKIVRRDKCLAGAEKIFCDILLQSRDGDYYEGAIIKHGNLYMAVNIHNASLYLSTTLTLSEEDKERVKDFYRKKLNQDGKKDGEELSFKEIEERVSNIANVGHKVNELTDLQIGQAIIGYYLFHPDIKEALSKEKYNHIFNITVIAFVREGGQPIALNYGHLTQKQFTTTYIDKGLYQTAMSTLIISGVDETFKSHFANKIQFEKAIGGPTNIQKSGVEQSGPEEDSRTQRRRRRRRPPSRR